MSYNAIVFETQFPIVKRFIYHYVFHKELSRAYKKLNLESEFWTLTIDAHLLQSSIHWCMVFGAKGCNPTHWAHLSDGDVRSLQEQFRKGLINSVDITFDEWEEYWQKMKNFRDQYVAHRELNFNSPVPRFTLALNIAYFYDRWIRDLIFPEIFEEPPLEDTAKKLTKYSSWLSKKLMKQSKNYTESGSRGFLTPSPHTTRHAGPHRAVR